MKIILAIFIAIVVLGSCSNRQTALKNNTITDTLLLSQEATGSELIIDVWKGKAHNYPQLAIWLETVDGKYIQTIYVSESIAKGEFKYGQTDKGKWQPGEKRRPASLPVWAHKRGVKESDGLYVPDKEHPVADAYTGATPLNNFHIVAKTDKKIPDAFVVKLEVNQAWDWNEYWTNDRYPDDEDYKSSSQPSLIYSAQINKTIKEAELKLTGHGHFSGDNGKVNPDISTITSAKDIFNKIVVKLKQ